MISGYRAVETDLCTEISTEIGESGLPVTYRQAGGQISVE